MSKTTTTEKTKSVGKDVGFAVVTKGFEGLKKRYRVGAYGLNRSGKTMFAGSWPDVLYLDFDDGARTLQSFFPDKKDVVHVSFKFGTGIIDGLDQMFIWLVDRDGPFKNWFPQTVVVDSVKSMNVSMEHELIEKGYESASKDKENVSLGDYRVLLTRTMALINRLKTLDVNVLLLDTLMFQEKTGDYVPAASGKILPGAIMDSMDYNVLFEKCEGDDGAPRYQANFDCFREMKNFGYRGKVKKGIVKNLDYKKFCENVE
jgi:hypothetical protein